MEKNRVIWMVSLNWITKECCSARCSIDFSWSQLLVWQCNYLFRLVGDRWVCMQIYGRIYLLIVPLWCGIKRTICYHCNVFYWIREIYHCIFGEGFGPLCKVMQYEDQWLLGLIFLEIKTHKSCWTKIHSENLIRESRQLSLTPSLLTVQINQGKHK